MQDPELLLYRRINHRFNCDGVMARYKGTVLSYDESTREYRIAYDNEDEIFSFPLLEDLENNDLQFY